MVKDKNKAYHPVKNPYTKRWFITSVILTIFLIIILFLNILFSFYLLNSFKNKELATERESRKLLLYAETMQMSVRISAASGNLKWQEEYIKTKHKLEKALNEISLLVFNQETIIRIEEIKSYIEKIGGIESEAFRLVSRGMKDEAVDLLAGWKYTKNQLKLSKVTKNFVSYIKTSIENKISVYKTQITFLTLVVVLFIIILFFLWRKTVGLWNIQIEKRQKAEKELQYANDKIMDSIRYAQIIQNAILPNNKELSRAFAHNFILWMPRDIVGGDYYWFKKTKDGFLFSLIDCTGHGVPGALMSMLSKAVLDGIVAHSCDDNPAEILKELNIMLKKNLYDGNKDKRINEGLDIGVCYITPQKKKMVYAGAKISLYVSENGQVKRIKGDKQSLGYRRSKLDYQYTNKEIDFFDNDSFYLTSDGYVDQLGGEKKRSFGRKNFIKILESEYNKSFEEQKEKILESLKDYMGNTNQMDDITVVGFKI